MNKACTMWGVFITDGDSKLPIAIFEYADSATDWAKKQYTVGYELRQVEIGALSVISRSVLIP